MVALPAVGSFVAGAGSNESRGLLLENWLAFTRRMPGGTGEQQATIAAGSITPSAYYVQVDTEGQTASDDLDFLVGTGWEVGQIVCLRSLDASRVVNVRHARGTTNQIFLTDGATWPLISSSMRLYLMRTSSQWLEIDRDFGNQHAAYRVWRDLDIDSGARLIGNRTAITDRLATDQILINRGGVLRRMNLSVLFDVLGLNRWDSGDLGIGPSVGGTYEHGLGREPMSVEAIMRCLTANVSYNPGDCIRLDNGFSGGVARGVSIWFNSTYVGYRCTDVAPPIAVFDRNSGALANINGNNWAINIRAWG